MPIIRKAGRNMMTEDPPFDISLIEHFSFCPKQAENKLKGESEDDDVMEDGRIAHEGHEDYERQNRAKIRMSFKKSRQAGKKPGLKGAVELCLKGWIPEKFVEVYVESKKLGVVGKCDEVQIEKGKVRIIDYKTTFRRDDRPYMPDAAVAQLRAYAQSFMETFGYSGKIDLVIIRVFLEYDSVYADYVQEDEVVPLNAEGKYLADGWKGSTRKVYDLPFYPDVDVDEVRDIIKKIRKKDFVHGDNPNKCHYCPDNKVCVDAVLPKTSSK